MPKQYLMIETKDKRKFFTYRENLPQLIEFSKTFNAEISVVRTDEAPLDMLSLAENICGNDCKIHKPNFEIVEVKIGKNSKNKHQHKSKIIKNFIQKKILAGKPMCLRELSERYEKYQLDNTTIYNYLTSVRKKLANDGFPTERVSRGVYQLRKPT